MAEHWMQKAFAGVKKKGHEGIFKRAAARAGMSTHSYAEKKKHAGGVMSKRANLALRGMEAKH